MNQKELLTRLVSARSKDDTDESFAEYLISSLGLSGYVILKEADRFAMQEKAWKYDELSK